VHRTSTPSGGTSRRSTSPQPTDLSYEELFHDYYFDTGRERDCEALFCPTYSTGLDRDPVSNATEPFLSVGLDSGLSETEFSRKRLNLVVVVDTSESMSADLGQYYYDGGDGQPTDERTSKMAATRSALRTITGHLGPDDRLGIVAYDDRARVVQDVVRMGEVSESALEGQIDGLRAGGSTNLDAGMRTAVELLRPHACADARAVET
jgi:Ca-activated chloride channel family protein